LHSAHNKSENIRKAKSFVAEAAGGGARLVALPEVFTFRGMIRAEKGVKLSKTFFMERIADEIPGPTIAEFQKLAAQYKIFILAGSVYERSADPERAYNASVLVAGDGSILQTYRKIHLFNAQVGGKKYCESDYFLSGQDFQTARVGDFTVGMSVCYD
ncbi:MAG: hydrolase, partial [Candidatus Omnitrophica bacterium CG12_big_fil_rev_8_21_14_0_65_50_5]